MFEAAKTARVLDRDQLETIRPFLEGIRPMPAVFDQYYVKRLNGCNVKKGKNKRDLAEQLRADIQAYKKVTQRQVMIWCGSTEIFLTPRRSTSPWPRLKRVWKRTTSISRPR
jgi:myo-inositol-1-phosphate synthase